MNKEMREMRYTLAKREVQDFQYAVTRSIIEWSDWFNGRGLGFGYISPKVAHSMLIRMSEEGVVIKSYRGKGCYWAYTYRKAVGK